MSHVPGATARVLTDAELIREVVTTGVATAFGTWLAAGRTGARSKSNQTDVVTVADEAAEAAMLELIARHRPLDAVVGEEGSVRGGVSGRTWVLDPLDGTYNFTRSSERWCSAAALVVEEVAALGAVSGGGAARTWVGGQGLGCAEDGTRLSEISEVSLEDACVLTYLHPPHHATEVGAAWRRLVGGAATWRSTGSGSLDAADVACGRAELSVQHSVPVWDSAPGEALVRAAGGTSARTWAAGVEWFLLGSSRVVGEAVELLEGG